MKAVALQSTSDSAPARKQQVVGHPPPISHWVIQTASVNQALIQRKADCACGGGCPRCADESHAPTVQTKLAVSTPGDQFEQEADRVAEQVMMLPQADNPRDAETGNGGQLRVSRYASPAGADDASGVTAHSHDAPPAVHDVLRSTGEPLDAATRVFMESQFGHDFSGVRVHSNAQAAESARAVNALAYTVGQDVVFGQGKYAPDTITGKKLLAHELTHTLQQSRTSTAETILQRKPDEGKDLPVKPPAPKPAASCPTFVSLTATISTPTVSDSCKDKCRMGLGCCTTPRGTCGSTKDSGAAYKGTIKVPTGCTGELAFAQNLVSTDRKRTLTNKSKECVALTSPHADGVLPWKGCKISVATAGSHTVESDDCPNILLRDNMTSASVKESFKTFFIWKGTSDKDWKTIGMVSWSWSASTQQKQGTDCASRWTAPGGSGSTVKGAASTEVPVATPKVQGDASKWLPCEKED